MGRQLVFDLARAPSYEADAFLTSPSNDRAHAMVERWPDWPARTLLMVGPEGSGKSHLGAIWAMHAGARTIRRGEALDPSMDPAVLLVEDADRAGHSEADLFHLINLVKERDGWLLMTARSRPDHWGVVTADLLSRLRLAPIISIDAPDADLIRAVIVKLFADRQIRIEPDVVAYAALHGDQSLEAVSRFVAAVDEDALAENRRITRPVAARTLARLHGEPDL